MILRIARALLLTETAEQPWKAGAAEMKEGHIPLAIADSFLALTLLHTWIATVINTPIEDHIAINSSAEDSKLGAVMRLMRVREVGKEVEAAVETSWVSVRPQAFVLFPQDDRYCFCCS